MLDKAFFTRSLNVHAYLGLMVGALMYLICLSGSLAVYYEELERWEQPAAQEYLEFDIETIDSAFNRLLQENPDAVTPHMYVTLPTAANPRVAISTEEQGWYVDQSGNLGPTTAHPWSTLLTDLHLYLHLPESWGMILVSTLGVFLLALIISGFMSHRTLFKDAFKLRMFGNKQLEQTDLHNRLSVWGAPFYVVIAVTGAFFGLAMFALYLYASVYNQGDIQGLSKQVYGSEPELNQAIETIALAKAFQQMPDLAPQTTPLFAIVHDTGTPGQFIEIYSQYPNRLIYSDNFVFDASGRFLSRDGFSDGEAGKQIVYSMYRLHFGHFGGWWTKALYLILGLALTVVSVSGVNLWLTKRRKRDAINNLWVGLVWGTLVALSVTAAYRFLTNDAPSWLFWLTLLVSAGYAHWVNHEASAKRHLILAWLCSSVAVLITYVAQYGPAAATPISFWVNGLMLAIPLAFCTLTISNTRRLETNARPT
ncbi:hypothetical protein GCM10008090_28800 [Arenicella chitinivorans]|uniref:PepSY domain-containing protein n=1 Tax=Arenicella chitinivorans TaxID=1329800 RepID=A0A918S262_9GAMM|nr:PepSY-associated TM helix domain-containing protein [Arenicella chitinivorans]GHA17349.1 hypothetical protein GCM10008090_28800 [Arenicella chitinivorans]